MKEPVSRTPEKVAARILDAAQGEFMRAGYEAASTNAITEAFGGSKATLFRHFPTKLMLIEAVVRRIAGRWRGQIAWRDIAEDEPGAWLTAFTIMTLDWILMDEVLFLGRLGIAEGHKLPELQSVFRETAAAPLERVLAERFHGWTTAGRLACADPDADAVSFLDLAVSGVVSRALYGAGVPGAKARKAHAARVTELFLNGRRKRN